MADDLTLAGILTSGSIYTAEFTIANLTAGNVTPVLGTKTGTVRSANGQYSEDIKANGTDFILRASDTFVGDITQFSCTLFDAYTYDPQAMLSWSDDGGHNWSNEHFKSMGGTGQYGKRVLWHRLGSSRDRIFKMAVSAPMKKIIIAGFLNYRIGAH
jgi:hypothetical protein